VTIGVLASAAADAAKKVAASKPNTRRVLRSRRANEVRATRTILTRADANTQFAWGSHDTARGGYWSEASGNWSTRRCPEGKELPMQSTRSTEEGGPPG